MEGLDVGDELAAGGTGIGRRHGDLAAELVRLVRLPFADAFDLGRVERIDLGQGVAPLLGRHPLGQPQGAAEGIP